MTIQPIGAASVALYFTPDDLSQYGASPAGLTLEQAKRLTREACRRAGLTLDGSVEIEAYPECCGVLVFAHILPAGPLWFAFDDIEPVLSAAVALRHAPVDAALWWWEGKYWLSLPQEAEDAADRCRDFGAQQPHDPARAGKLDEQGRAIFLHNALWALYQHFLRLHL